jgi:hypothetical protein
MGNIMISAWYALGKEVCWWHSHPINAHIVQERVFRWRVNFKTDVRSAVAQAGHMSLKTHLPSDEWQHATSK